MTAAVLLSWAAIGSQAVAQTFLQQLFGLSPPPQAVTPADRPTPMTTPGGRPYTFPGSSPGQRRSLDDDDDRDNRAGRYRTVCVRMCDGYFFPISNSTTKRGFFRDQMKCRATCGDDARLFHLPVGSTDIATANDGNGRIYGLLAIAHKYKKSLTPGCQCRPQPWTEAEQARHAQYAEAEAERAAATRAAQLRQEDDAASEPAPATASRSGTAAEPAAAPAAPRLVVATRPAVKPIPPPRTEIAARQPVLHQAPRLAPTPKSAPAGAMGLGAGGPYAWPGDAPRR